MQMKAKMRGTFLTQLQQRSAKWKALPDKVAARIVVPPELSWWYWQEWGVPHGYTISHRNATKIAYPSSGGQVVADSVEHPGLKARHIVGNVLKEIQSDTRRRIREFLRAGGAADPQGLQMILMEAAALAKEKIAESMAQQLPGLPRPAPDPRFVETQSGKLKGAKASDVYRALAKVINSSR